MLRPGRNWLMACVNNTRTRDRVPMRNTDWFNYGGLYRDVSLFETPRALIKDFFLYLVPDGTFSKVCAEVEISERRRARQRCSFPVFRLRQRFRFATAGAGSRWP